MAAFDLSMAMRAEGTTFGNRNLQWHPVDNDIEKTADDDTDDKDINIKDEVDEFDHKTNILSELLFFFCFQIPGGIPGDQAAAGIDNRVNYGVPVFIDNGDDDNKKGSPLPPWESPG